MTDCGGDDSRVPKGDGLRGPEFASSALNATYAPNEVSLLTLLAHVEAILCYP